MAFSFLDGVRVLDLSQYLPGPLGTQILSDMGADVIKVEPPRGDPMLALDPVSGTAATPTDDDLSPFYKVLNAGKRVVRLDLKSDAGRATFSDLIAESDVLLESFRPGVMTRLGFDYAAAQALNPKIIYCALTGYGQTGPKRLDAGHDLNYMAFSGALSQAGDGQGPALAWPPMADCAGAVISALSILGALVRRGRTGEGAFLDVAMADCVLSWQALGLTAEKIGKGQGRGDGLLTGGAACYRAYRTADGKFLTVGALEENFWRNFCDAVGQQDWTARQWEPLPQKDLIAEVSAFIGAAPLAQWLERLDGVDTCVQAAAEYADIPADPQVKARGLLQDDGQSGIEVLLPFLAGGETSGERPAVEITGVEKIIAEWKSA